MLVVDGRRASSDIDQRWLGGKNLLSTIAVFWQSYCSAGTIRWLRATGR